MSMTLVRLHKITPAFVVKIYILHILFVRPLCSSSEKKNLLLCSLSGLRKNNKYLVGIS